MSILYLVCASESEADKIAEVLLEKKLVACVKKLPVESAFLWEGKVKKASEVVLLLETREGLFLRIEEAIAKIHSHKTFVLASIPVSGVSGGVEEWLEQELNGE